MPGPWFGESRIFCLLGGVPTFTFESRGRDMRCGRWKPNGAVMGVYDRGMARRVLLVAGAVGLLLIGVGRAAVQSSRWSAPELLAARTGNLLAPVGVGTSQSILAWASSRGVFAAVAGSAGRFGPPEQLAAGGLSFDLAQPLLATDARGDAIVIWERPYSAKISPADPLPGKGSLYASYRPAGGKFEAAHLIARDAKRAIVAMDGHGNALVAWGQTHGQGAQSIDVVQRSSNGSYSSVAVLATVAVSLSGVAMDPADDAVVVWESAPASPGPVRIEAATREHDGVFGAPVPIAPAGVEAVPGSVAIDRAGRALIAWDRLSDGTEESVAVTSLQAGATTPGPSQTLRAPSRGTPEAILPSIESDQSATRS